LMMVWIGGGPMHISQLTFPAMYFALSMLVSALTYYKCPSENFLSH
jgi:hypothetical protein